MEPIYDYEQAAEYLKISVPTLKRRKKAKLISFFRDGSRVFFAQSHCDEYRASTLVVAKTKKLQLVKRSA